MYALLLHLANFGGTTPSAFLYPLLVTRSSTSIFCLGLRFQPHRFSMKPNRRSHPNNFPRRSELICFRCPSNLTI
ncbi:hypothetical protein K450DRAFT_220647 [Umbelopsis ramanniana AG]|uniref:Uncharacterized protein n=1 Tax=Umbelopsis ramanniana AG TaxID=1314678 RepID=A0AAD5EHT1_UMBRA|nr:uncharacterized protein K450DRAFT_220647 [Umbelopsis ramanniana AG]KAI8583928.1 hypothetical protein K450DRAFT_220647 [Umbelopsis ramanniana AG]